MIVAAVLILAVGLLSQWRWAALIACALAVGQWWRLQAELSLSALTLQTGLLMLLPSVPWSAQRAEVLRRRQMEAQQAVVQRSTDALRGELDHLHQQQEQLSAEINQLVELYRVTKETAGEVQLAGFFEELTKILSTVLTFKAWHLLLVAPAHGGVIPTVEEAWTGVVERGTIQIRPVQSPPACAAPADDIGDAVGKPAWHAALVQVLQHDTAPQWVHRGAGEHAFVRENDLAWIPLTYHDRLRAVMVFEQLPEPAFAHAQIIAQQVALQLERVLLYQELERLAVSDSLTELPVRRFFLQRLEDELARARRHEAPGALVMIDIDHFKALNDQYGHLVGDEVMRSIGALIRANVREIDLTARYGGEEFALYLVETPQESALAVAERMRRTIASQTIRAYDETVHVTVSLGIAMFPVHGEVSAELLEHADQALYQAKSQGRNRVVLYGAAA